MRTIVRNGLRDGGDLTEGVDYIFPDRVDKDEDEIEDLSDWIKGVDYIFPDRVDKDEDEIEDTKTIAQTDGLPNDDQASEV